MRLLTAVILFALWLVLSATFDPAHVVVGALIAALVAWINPALPHLRRLSWIEALTYQPWLFGRILKSGLHVSRLILDPKLPISPELIEHKTPFKNDGELVALGNSITLTPGTITVEVSPGELIVHAIDDESRKDFLDGSFEDKIGRIFIPKEGER